MKPMNETLGTSILLDACNETLFRVISEVSCEDGEDQPDFAIRAEDFNAVSTGLDKWLEQHAHAVVKQLVLNRGPPGSRKLIEFCNREISEQDHSVFGRFSASRLFDVTNGYVNRPCVLVSAESR